MPVLSGHRWKLADFNLATRFTPGDYMVDHVGTRPFTAPEVPQHRYTEKCDIYSNLQDFLIFMDPHTEPEVQSSEQGDYFRRRPPRAQSYRN